MSMAELVKGFTDKEADVVIIGAGPKGVALHTEAQLAGLDSLLIESGNQVAPLWSAIDPQMTMTPGGHEILDREGLRYIDRCGDRRPTIGQYSQYLSGLGSEEIVRRGLLLRQQVIDLIPRDLEGVKVVTASGLIVNARSVVVSTGFVGGQKEFVTDPTGLRSSSEVVRQYPFDFTSEEDFGDFVKGARRIAIVGGGFTAASSLEALQTACGPDDRPWVCMIANNTLNPVDPVERYSSDADGTTVTGFPNWSTATMESFCSVTYEYTRVIGATDLGDSVVLHYSNNRVGSPQTLEVDRVLIAAGYRPDFRHLSFLNRIVANNDLRSHSGDPLSPELSKTGKVRNLPMHFLGGLAAAVKGPAERLLNSTVNAVKGILRDIAS